MGFTLPVIDLSAATAGATGVIDLSPASPSANAVFQGDQAAHLAIYNESGAGLALSFNVGGASEFIPGGGWRSLALQPGTTQITYTVIYVIAGAGVTKLIAVYYFPGERVPDIGILGNSPVGVGGTVSTSGSTSIKNDGNGPATTLIEATPSDQGSSSWAFNNDASGFLQVLSAAVLRKILNVVRGDAGTTKAIITLGDAGDPSILTMHGTADQVPAAGVQAGTLGAAVDMTNITSDAGNFSTDGTGTLTWARTLSAANQLADLQQGYGLYSDNTANVFPGATNRLWIDSGATGEVHIGGRASTSVLKGIRFRALQLKLDPNTGGTITTSGFRAGTGAGSGTYTHGMGVTPRVAVCQLDSGSNSTSFGTTSLGSTTLGVFEFSTTAAFDWFVFAN